MKNFETTKEHLKMELDLYDQFSKLENEAELLYDEINDFISNAQSYAKDYGNEVGVLTTKKEKDRCYSMIQKSRQYIYEELEQTYSTVVVGEIKFKCVKVEDSSSNALLEQHIADVIKLDDTILEWPGIIWACSEIDRSDHYDLDELEFKDLDMILNELLTDRVLSSNSFKWFYMYPDDKGKIKMEFNCYLKFPKEVEAEEEE